MLETYYLKDNEGCPIAVFEVDKRNGYSVMGRCYSPYSWNVDNTVIYDKHLVADVYCKWDSCTHWRFWGEDWQEEGDETDSYYHLCGTYRFSNHIRCMCFVWKLVAMLMCESDDNRGLYTQEYYYETQEIRDLIEFILKDHSIVKGEKT